MALIWLAWILIIIGIATLAALIIHVEFGREISIPFSVIMVIIASFSLGFGIHIFLGV
ncbi:MAG: hypothetical protein ACTSRZ_11360 [Promethearchaeota archaeon]